MKVHFSTDDLPSKDRVKVWLDHYAKLAHSVTPGPVTDTDSFRATASGHVLGGFGLLYVKTAFETAQRTAADVARDKEDAFFIRRFRRPMVWKTAPKSTLVDLVHLQGDFCVSSGEWRFDAESMGGAEFEMLVIPHAALSPQLAGGRVGRPFRLPAASPLGSLLGAALDAANAQVPLLPEVLAVAVLRNLTGLVALACGASEEGMLEGRKSARAAQLAAAKRYIDEQLSDPDLSPAGVSGVLGMSVRQLHRLFEASGSSFARYVLRQRLIRCRDAIGGATGSGRSVVDIALGWGFNSMATFYRAFANEFGAAPTALRAASQTGELA